MNLYVWFYLFSCKSHKYVRSFLPSRKREMSRGTRREVSRTILWACSCKQKQKTKITTAAWKQHSILLNSQLQSASKTKPDHSCMLLCCYVQKKYKKISSGHFYFLLSLLHKQIIRVFHSKCRKKKKVCRNFLKLNQKSSKCLFFHTNLNIFSLLLTLLCWAMYTNILYTIYILLSYEIFNIIIWWFGRRKAALQ